jgi:hypothetical protein
MHCVWSLGAMQMKTMKIMGQRRIETEVDGAGGGECVCVCVTDKRCNVESTSTLS